jgi:phytoene synthase
MPLMPQGEAAIGGLARDPDRDLALAYVPAGRRAALAALWALDSAFGRALSGGREKMIGRIKLAWWREALEALDRTAAPAEPVLRALQKRVLPSGVSGAALARMEEGWVALSSDAPLVTADLDEHARLRGGLLFLYSARLLGAEAEGLEQAGEAWALVDLARHSGNQADVEAALAAARRRSIPRRWALPLRPLGMLAALARRDLEAGRTSWETPGAPGRMIRMLGMRLIGR